MSSRPTMRRWPFAVRLYGLLLRTVPRELDRAETAAATETFHDLYREAGSERGAAGALNYWLWSSCRWIAGDPAGSAGDPAGAAGDPVRPGGDPAGHRPEHRWRETVATLVQDLRYASRTLRKKPVFAVSAVLILATGIGATTSIFSIVDTVLLRRLPYPQPGELVVFTEGAHSFPNFDAWTTFESFRLVGAAWDDRVDLTGDGSPEQIFAARVSPDFFAIFAAETSLGRLFVREEHIGEPRVVVLGYGLWQRRWGGDPSLVGSTILIDGSPMTVVGVLSPAFTPPEHLTGARVDAWLPLDMKNPERMASEGLHVLSVAGRLADGVSIEAAQAQMDAYIRARAVESPDYFLREDGSYRDIPLLPLREATVERVSQTLYVLLGAVVLMLLIACANVANLFLARGTERGREIALRGALGASRGRIFSQLLTETVFLAVIGGLVGVIVAYVGVGLFAATSPGNIPRLQAVAVDLRVLVFAFLISVTTGVVFGCLPALQAARADVNEMLKDGAANVTTGRKGRRTRGTLVVAEVALALVLLTGAGLLFRSFVEIIGVDPGFETEDLVTVSLQLGPTYTDSERVQFVSALRERLAALPGAEAVGGGWTIPFVVHGNSRCCWRTSIRDAAAPADAERVETMAHPVTADYFATLGVALAEGREFVASDGSSGGAAPVVLNGVIAQRLYPEGRVVGRTVMLYDVPMTVIGVVEGVHHYGLNQRIEPTVYVPYDRYGGEFGSVNLAVRSRGATDAVAAGIREAVWSLDRNLPIQEIVTMRQRVATSLNTQRFLAGLLAAFAAVALLLACGGIYGSMLYSVGQRQREMGIRLALGAAGTTVIRLILAHGALLTGLGLALGIAGAMALSRVMQNFVWGIEATDPLTFAGVTLLLAAAALSACFFPAWKAARTDPLDTLRSE